MSSFPPPRGVRGETGIGLRAPHVAALMSERPAVGFLEVHSENYMGGGAPLRHLEMARREWPISLHGVGLSLGSADGLDARHLARLASLAERIAPSLVSEHLSWSTTNGAYLNDLLPLPYTAESLDAVAENVAVAQDWLRRPILVENPSAYLAFAHGEMDEAAFLAALARRTGCGILLDVNNLYVSTRNLGGDADAYLAALPDGAVGEIHLAGHAVNDVDGRPLLIDDHGSRVAAPVWALFEAAIRRWPDAPALIERDSNLPPLATLVAEAEDAKRRRHAIRHEAIRHEAIHHEGGHHAIAA